MKRTIQRGMTAAALAAIMLLSCANEQEAEVNTPRAVTVKAIVVQPADYTVNRSFTGTLEGDQQADIYARIAEAVEQVKVREGQHVKEGQILIALDKSGPTSSYRNAESIYRNAEKNFQKMEYLFTEGAVSESQYDAAHTEYEVAKANFESAAQLVEVRSPVTGVVTSLDVAPGDYLRTGQKLATIASLDRLRVTCGLNARDVTAVREGDTVFVSSSEVAATLPGEVVSVARSADPGTRAFDVEVSIDNQKRLLHPGMFVRVSLVLEQLSNVLVVPHQAIVELDNKPTVFVVNGGVAHRRSITRTAEIEAGVVIGTGLEAGDTLVTLGHTYLDDGFEVRISSLESETP